MAVVAVTGGTGILGRALVPALVAAGHEVRVLSRRARTSQVLVVRGDLRSGAGVDALLDGSDVLVHAATSPFRRTRATDVEGTRALMARARSIGLEHVVFPSIVGVDTHPLPYYRAKRAAEDEVERGGVPWTIARATQFHDLLDGQFRALTRLMPVVPVPRGLQFQPVDSAEYAAVLVELVAAGPSGRAPDTGGPEVRRMPDLLRTWLAARRRRRPVVAFPAPGATMRAFRNGVNTCPERAVGRVTWEEYLDRG